MPEGGVHAGRRRFLEEHAAWIVFGVALLVTLASVFNHELWSPDEPREAQIGREMLLSGLSAVPRLSCEPFVEKPPLFPWLMSLAYAVFGVSAPVARLPAALLSALAVTFCFHLGRACGGLRAGLASSLVLLTTSKFSTTSFTAVNDTALTAFVAGGHLCFLRARLAERDTAWLLGAGACAAAAFLTKGLIGLILIFGPVLLALLFLRDGARLRRWMWRVPLFCGPIVVLVAGGWILAVAHESGWDVVRESVINNTVARTLGDAAREYGSYGHSNPFWYYLKAFPLGLLPWTLAVPALVSAGLLRDDPERGPVRFVAFVVLCGLALLSLPDGKRTLYFLPLLPAAATVIGTWLADVGSARGGRLDHGTVSLLLGLVAAAALAVSVTAAFFALEGIPIAKLARLDEDGHGPLLLAASLALGFAVEALRIWSAWRRTGSAATLRSAALLALAGVAGAGLVGRAVLDPVNELRSGAEQIVEAIGPEGPLVGYRLGETERAVLSFYGGRPLRNEHSREALDQRLAESGAREYVVEVHRRTEGFRERAAQHDQFVRRVELRPGDALEVYRLRDDPER